MIIEENLTRHTTNLLSNERSMLLHMVQQVETDFNYEKSHRINVLMEALSNAISSNPPAELTSQGPFSSAFSSLISRVPSRPSMFVGLDELHILGYN